MGPQGLGESVLQCARLWLLKQATWGAILGPSLLWGGARWFLPQSATFLPHLAPQCLSPKRTWWPVLVYGNFLKDKAANPEADGPAAQALTPDGLGRLRLTSLTYLETCCPYIKRRNCGKTERRSEPARRLPVDPEPLVYVYLPAERNVCY